MIPRNHSTDAEPGAGAWEAIHAQFAPEDAVRKLYLDAHPECATNAASVLAGRKAKGVPRPLRDSRAGRVCACGKQVRGGLTTCTRCSYGDEVRVCETFKCGAKWKRADHPTRRYCPACGRKRQRNGAHL